MELPPLADPELFESVFFQDFRSGESKFLPHHGDGLLKALTFDVLSELFGKENFQLIGNITPIVISNAFYEQIVLHYGLEKLASEYFGAGKAPSKTTTHRRGDLLEAYMAGIEQDVSRCGRGYREVREWLFQVLGLYLKKIEPRDGVSLYSTGSEHQSLSILTSVSTNPSKVKLPPCYRTGQSNDSECLRRLIFQCMGQVAQDVHTAGRWSSPNFWSNLCAHLSRYQGQRQNQADECLLLYYRV